MFRNYANDQTRTQVIAAEVQTAYSRGRKILVLTELNEHVDALHPLAGKAPLTFVLHGRMPRKQLAALVAELDALPPDSPRVLLST
jgi:hypothetical protein